jgi:hypothetical protein
MIGKSVRLADLLEYESVREPLDSGKEKGR